MNTNLLKIKQRIAKGELKLAISELQEISKNTPLLNDVILQSSRLSRLSKKIHKGIVKPEDAEITKNQITDGILALVDEMEFEIRDNQAARDELDKFFLSYKDLKEEEGKYTLEQKKARFRHFDNYDNFINSKPPEERLKLQKLNSESYLKKFGLSVRELKTKLHILNYFDGELDNKFDRELANSLEMFQLDNNMRHIDGFFGELTYDMIALRLSQR